MGMGMGGKAGDEEDETTEELLRAYKKNSIKNGVPTLKSIEEKFDYAFEEGDGTLEKIAIWDEAGPMVIRSFFDAAKDVKKGAGYEHLKTVNIWRADAQDEGVRSICEFLKKEPCKVKTLDLLSNNISPLGCEFLGTMLNFRQLEELRLDHNLFGTAGLKELARGLSKIKTLTLLSMTYCGIDEEGAKYLQ